MPSKKSSFGALPARFRRQRILIIGLGDVGTRVANMLPAGVRKLALIRDPSRADSARRLGACPVLGDLDDRQSLHRLAGLAHHVLHLAPPAQQGSTDERTRHLVRALSKAGLPRSLVYVSTSGVYGDCGGDWIREERMANPQTPRARRRVHAERLVRNWGRTQGVRVSVLRVPGIYANDRAEGGARARLERRLPVLLATEDVYTNHIHADDLARACQRAIWLARPQRVYNVNDDTCLKMGDYFDSAADLYGLDRPPRVPRTELQNSVSAMQLSFMSESRRMRNERMKQELRLLLAYPSVHDGLRGFCRIRISRRDTRSESPQMHPDGPAADRPGRVRTAVPVPPG